MTTFFASHAWLPSGVARDARITVHSGRIAAVETGARQPGDVPLPGLVLPGFANTHSHAFHRALRGRTHEAGTFWTWRERMYAVAGRIDPDSYFAMARATYAEMALAGVSAVGEFHYLHHAPDGRPYADPNAMGHALRAAAREAGVRFTLLDACYLAGGIGQPLSGVARRFGDGSAAAWARRVAALAADESSVIGAAIHSVRAVPRTALPEVVEVAEGRPLHVHLSEQSAENEQCLAAYGVTPAQLLADAGALGAQTTAVHATHVTDADIALLGGAGSTVSICPTTERDLADGIGPSRRLYDAGAPITLGTDQHALIDMFEEARALEMHERLATGQRGRFTPAQLVAALTGHPALGWPDAGRIAPGLRADLVAVRLDTVRTAGVDPAQAVLAAFAADVDTVIVDGRMIVSGGRHVLGDIGELLRSAMP
ncbi:MAG TPA: formimidoylglutamate deiminase [Jatrophihabitantaceae bacterium]|jgi:formiminoglutamate deiminase